MKPGDLVTIRKIHLSLKLPISYLDVYERIDGEEDINVIWKWEHGEVGVLMEGRDEVQEMAQVLHKGRIGWVDEEYLRVVDESRSDRSLVNAGEDVYDNNNKEK